MTPDQALRKARAGELLPMYVVVGEEALLADEVVRGLREVAVGDSPTAAFNVEKLHAGEATAEKTVNNARTLPMMAARRFVVLQGAERWDTKAATKEDTPPLDVLAEYAAAPSLTSVLIVVGSKINGSRRLMRAAKKGGFLVQCEPLSRQALPRWITDEAKARGHTLERGIAETLAELLGPDLGPVRDAVERLSLFVGPGATITEGALSQVVTRVRLKTVWQLVDALSDRALGRAMAAVHDAYDPRDHGLRLLGAVGMRLRQLVKYQSARAAGRSPNDAARQAGVPGFNTSATENIVRRLPRAKLEQWLAALSEADQALKSSRRPALAILEAMVLQMCA